MEQTAEHHFWVNHEKARAFQIRFGQVHLDRDLLGEWP